MTGSLLPAGRDVTVEHGRLSEVASTRLGAGIRIAVLRDDDGRHFAAPVIDGDTPRRAAAGEGAAEALIRTIARGAALDEGFAVHSWHSRDCAGESGINVDQTNESVVVGDAAVVKWAVEVGPGPHPALERLETLVHAGFTDLPRPWGALTWRASAHDDPRLIATVVDYLPDAQDGWEWAVADVREAAAVGDHTAVRNFAGALGGLVAEMHAALASSGERQLSAADAARWADDARIELDAAIDLTDGPEGERLSARADQLRERLEALQVAEGTPAIGVHGDLHVGQILRSQGRYVVIDFDGNPVLSATERLRPQPAAIDVAGMLQSLENVAHVVAKRTDGVDAAVLTRLTKTACDTFLSTYRETLDRRGCAELLDDRLIVPLRVRQICREYLYAAKHLRRWLYVPDAALAALDG